ncbi:serine hydrolase, partial [bacterium]|nr:serine hydrolase [bacterium]
MTTKMLRALIIACVPFTTFPAAGMTLGGPPTHAPDRPAGVTVWRTAPADVSSSFAAIVSNRNIPGLMGVRLDGGMVTASGIAGVRVRGQNGNALQISDVMHYGSMFKAQTATLGGILVDAGVITWDARLLDYVTPTQKSAFIATDARWTNVTLRQLLSMSSGVKEELVPYDIPAVYRCNANPAAGRQ